MLINRSHHKIVVWYNPSKDFYYYKAISGFFKDYFVGFKNQYGHIVVLVIELEFYRSRSKLSKRILKKAISFLDNIYRRI